MRSSVVPIYIIIIIIIIIIRNNFGPSLTYFSYSCRKLEGPRSFCRIATATMAYWSFVHYGKGYVDTMHLHQEGQNVSFNGGIRHGRWYQAPGNTDICIEWHCKAEQENVAMHIYRRLPADVNVWELIRRDENPVPYNNHPWRCLLMMTNTQPICGQPGPMTPTPGPMPQTPA